MTGVQRIEIFGARTFAMRIWLRPERMAALHISPSQVREALTANNYLAAVGNTKGSLVRRPIWREHRHAQPAEFRRLVIYQQDGAIVRLQDIAEVELGAEDYDTVVRYSGDTAVFVGLHPAQTPTSSR